jgi:hypothetical protein
MVHWWGKNQVAEKCRSAILTTYETDLRTASAKNDNGKPFRPTTSPFSTNTPPTI